MEKERSILSGVGLEHKCRVMELSIVCYFINQLPTSKLVDKTHHEAWNGKKPSLEHVRGFRCDAHVHVPKEKRRKIDNKGENVYLLVIYME
jgi:hypothetical protein